jgi:hypothetical protein
VVQYLLSSEGGASITETDDAGNTALLLAATACEYQQTTVLWLLEHGGAQITDTNHEGESVWTGDLVQRDLPRVLKCAYDMSEDGNYIPTEKTEEVTTMLRTIVLHGAPPASLIIDLAPPLQVIVQDGVRLRARLPAYLTQRRALLDAAPGPGTRLRGAHHHRRALGHGARGTPAKRKLS